MDDLTYRQLKEIEQYDPDGREQEPTPADYARFEAWVVATYGQAVWQLYIGGSWAFPSVRDWEDFLVASR